ncbi:MAG: amino acid permease [Balneola sp.]
MEYKKLKKELGLWDVYAIATGAMFSSGFFLLPGLAAAETGPSVFLAYLVSGLIVLPTMFSVAELATAMPKAGGTYYIIDRSLGPLIGTIGGYGSWLALVLKSAFALIGMGAYLSIYFDVPIIPVAIILTLVFGVLNIVGAKETTALQKILVSTLVSIMIFYIVQGLFAVFSIDIIEVTQQQFTPLFTNGAGGFFATVGMVFVSYAGLTKVASIAEEVKDPDKNIPYGMFLSIITAILVYVIGVYIMVALLEPSTFREDLTPVATAGKVFMDWLPNDLGILLIVVAAVAAFASTGNAGIMSASRYPLAMARDHLITGKFSKVSKNGTPYLAIIATVLLMIISLLTLNVAEVAKLASAFQLLLFGLLNFCIIVMRESRITGYDPGFNSPLYPWLQIIGIISSIVLILEMGFLSILFTTVISIFAIAWYYYYARNKTDREGAIFHIHERLGKRKDHGLEREMKGIIREKGLRKEDPYEKVISRSVVLDETDPKLSYKEIIHNASDKISKSIGMTKEEVFDLFWESQDLDTIPFVPGIAFHHIKIKQDIPSEILLVRISENISLNPTGYEMLSKEDQDEIKKIRSIIFLVSSSENARQHLRILAHLSEVVDDDRFMVRWKHAKNDDELREVLLRDDRFIKVVVKENDPMVGKQIQELALPEECLIAIIKRNGKMKIPHGNTVIRVNDELAFIGEEEGILVLRDRFYDNE